MWYRAGSREKLLELPSECAAYKQPLGHEEAEKLLELAGIEYHRILATYVARREGLVDRDTCHLQWSCAQCVVVIVPAVLRVGDCEKKIIYQMRIEVVIHLFFVLINGKWHLVKVSSQPPTAPRRGE